MVLSVTSGVGSCSSEAEGEETDVRDWVSVSEAAELMEISPRTIQRSLAKEERRIHEWGAEGEGWRHKPLAERTIYQLRRSVVMRKAGKTED